LLSEVKFNKQQHTNISNAIGEIFNNLNEIFGELPQTLDIPLASPASSKSKQKGGKGNQTKQKSSQSVLKGDTIREGLSFYGQLDGEYQFDKSDPSSAPVFQFRRPRSLSIVGSFATRTAVKYDANVDIVVELPTVRTLPQTAHKV